MTSHSFRAVDLGAVTSQIIVELLSGPVPANRGLVAGGHEAAAVCRQLAKSDENLEPMLRRSIWAWAAAVESALAFTCPDSARRARHRGRATRDLRHAAPLKPVLDVLGLDFQHPMPAGSTIFVGSHVVALLAGPLADVLGEAESRRHLRDWLDRAREGQLQQLWEACRAVLGTTSGPDTHSPEIEAHPAAAPIELDMAWLWAERFDLALPSTVRVHLEDLFKSLLPRSERHVDFAAVAAKSLQQLAWAESAPLLTAEPETSFGAIRGDQVFDTFFSRANLLGRFQRGVESDIGKELTNDDPGAGIVCWIRELDDSMARLLVVMRRAGGISARAAMLTPAAAQGLRRLSAGRMGDKALGAIPELAEVLFPQGEAAAVPQEQVLTIVPSPALLAFPFELLFPWTPDGPPPQAVQVNPGGRILTGRPPRRTGIPRIVGVFDESLPGAVLEMETLERLGAEGRVEAFAVSSISRLRSFLLEEQADVLVIAVHSDWTPAGPVLRFPRGPVAAAELLTVQFPAAVVLASCRSAQTVSGSARLSLPLVALRQGAQVVLGSRWPILDDASVRVAADVYDGLADGFDLEVVALRATHRERQAGVPPSVWASFAVFTR